MFNKHETKKLSLTLSLFFHKLEKEKNARNLLWTKILTSLDRKARIAISLKILTSLK